MANPQVENGYIRIANELHEAILAYPGLTGVDMKLIFYVIRQTYGWGKKKAQISYGEVSRACKIDRAGVMKSLLRLVDHNILFVQHTEGDRNANIVGLNKDFESWKSNIGWGEK